jgi:hypothetical protein
MSSGNTSNGRSNPSNRFVNTVIRGSADQAMLLNQDALVDRVNLLVSDIVAAVSFAGLQATLTSLSPLTKVSLIDV